MSIASSDATRRGASRHHVLVVSVLIVLGLGSSGCAGSLDACGGAGDLGCFDPVSETSRRVVAEPVEIAAIDAQTECATLGEFVTFGGRAAGATRLYLRFGDEWKSRGSVKRAFVVLQPVRATPPEPREIVIEAWRVNGSWDAQALRWAAQPQFIGPRSEATVEPHPVTPLYLDVTELSRVLAREDDGDHGILLLSTSAGTHGASYATGVAGGIPRLELYFDDGR